MRHDDIVLFKDNTYMRAQHGHVALQQQFYIKRTNQHVSKVG